MEFQSDVENQKFMKYFGSPYKSFCNLMTLRSGVVFMCICNIISSVFNLISMIILIFVSVNFNYTYFSFAPILFYVDLMNIIGSFIGLEAILKFKVKDLQSFYNFKSFEFIIRTTFETIVRVIQDFDSRDFVFEMILHFMHIFILGFTLKVIWSTIIRLKYNQTVLVAHGEDTLRLMQQQAINLANPKVITPGMAIYFSQVV